MATDASKNPEIRNITWHHAAVSREDRERLLNQCGTVIWLTGFSGSGKSTIASALDQMLIKSGHLTYILDGDNIRHGLNADLGFAPEDRAENIRRVGEVASLFADAGLLVITSFISPYRRDRDRVRGIVGPEHFIEIHLDVPLEVCEQRDPKNLYKKARAGEIKDFTGITAPYEPPETPELKIDTSTCTPDAAARCIVDYLRRRNITYCSGDESSCI